MRDQDRGRDADLVRLTRVFGPARARAMAPLLGYRLKQQPRAPQRAEAPDTDVVAWLPDDAIEPLDDLEVRPAADPLVRAWRLERYADTEAARDERPPEGEGLTAADLALKPRPLFHVPRLPPLEPWRSVEPRLHAALAGLLHGSRVDVPALVHKLSRGEAIRRIPRRSHRSWPGRVVVLVDGSRRHLPWFHDQVGVLLHLLDLLGETAVEPHFLPAEELVDAWQRHGLLPQVQGLAPDTAVLVLGDLGACSSMRQQRGLWAATGAALARRGVPAVALCPVPDALVPPDSRAAWCIVPWGPPAAAPDDDARRVRARRLLCFASMADLVQPGLLRELAAALPAGDADRVTVMDALDRPEWGRVGGSGAVLSDEHRPALRREFELGGFLDVPDGEDADPKRVADFQGGARDRVARWHKDLPPELLAAEVLAWEARDLPLDGAPEAFDPDAARAFLGRLHDHLCGAQARFAPEWWGYADRLLDALPDSGPVGDDARRQASRLWARLHRDGGAIPAYVDDADLAAAAVERDAPLRTWLLRQVGGQLVFQALDTEPDPHLDPPRPGSPLARVDAAALWVDHPARALQPLHDGLAIPLPPDGALRLRTDRARLDLRAWDPAAPDTPDAPPWARAWGHDQYGLWADSDLGGVVQRFRWIPPGRFWMGSPPTEEGRFEREDRHRVTLTRGFWLGDTPVTQALWVVHRHRVPSRFRDPQRPVEQVDWRDARSFAEDLGCRLPTEAEWEHACRAGTTTATWRGDREYEGASSFKDGVGDAAPLLDDIAWYRGNSDGQTWPVKGKAPNPWGLYDMLGNVWEWCEDGWQEHLEGPETDPLTPPATASYRVHRGGSWYCSARNCRAAYRNWNHPSYQWSFRGFRLARGPAPGRQRPASAEAAHKQGAAPPQPAPGEGGPAEPADRTGRARGRRGRRREEDR